MYNQFLGIGSVVLLKGEGKKVMVIGYYGMDQTGRTVDYMGVVYPEGFFTPEKIVGFDQTEVMQVLHEGYKDIEQERYFADLRAFENGFSNQSKPTVPYQKATVPVQQSTQTVQTQQINPTTSNENIDTFE